MVSPPSPKAAGARRPADEGDPLRPGEGASSPPGGADLSHWPEGAGGSRWFERGGIKIHYVLSGKGEPVVMLHGNPTWSFYYRGLIEALSTERLCLAMDHVGMGLSDKPPEGRYDYRLASRVDDLEALLASLGLVSGLTLVLHDWGGVIGMAYAHRHPERVARLVVLNTAAFLMPEGRSIPWQLSLTRAPGLGALLVRGLNAFARGAASGCTVRPLTPEVRRAYLSPYGSWADRVAVLRFVQDIPLSADDPSYGLVREVDEGLHRFRRTPMLVCWGLKDFVFDRGYLAEWRRRFPEAELHAFEDAGHYVLEDAGDRIAPLVADFLRRHPLARAPTAGRPAGVET